MSTGKLREVIISVTDRCNLKCKMCDIPLDYREDELTTDNLVLLIYELKKLKPETIVFSGGEPLLRSDIISLVRTAKENGFRTCLTTNGVLVTPEVAKGLKAAGLDIANVSLEGPENINDYLRGRGTYRRSITALENLKNEEIETTIATCVSRLNYRNMSFILELAFDLKVTTVKFQAFSELFLKDTAKKEDFYLLKTEAAEIKKEISRVIKLAKTYGIYTNPTRYLEKLPDTLIKNHREKFRKGCSALWEICSINSRGEVYPCWVLNKESVGNITREPITLIWNSEKHAALRKNILRRGCAGCLLSCYDQEFRGRTIKDICFKLGAKLKLLLDIFLKVNIAQAEHEVKIKEIQSAKKKILHKLNELK